MSDSLEKSLKQARRSFKLVGSHCSGGCGFMKHEGTRSYVERAQISEGICTDCRKPVIKQECYDNDPCEHEALEKCR